MKRTTQLLLIGLPILLLCSFTACANKSDDTTAKSNLTDSKQTTQVEESTKSESPSDSWKSAYLDLVIDRSAWIQSYHPSDSEGTGKPAKPVALMDIDEDGIPELFLMGANMKDGVETGTLEIYTCKDGAAKKLKYRFPTQYHIVLTDQKAGSGSNYVVYKSKKRKQFYIHCALANGDMANYYVARYKLKNGKIKLKQRLKNSYTYLDDSIDDYWINGKSVSNAKGSSAFTRAYKDVKRAILYNGSDPDSSLWKNFKKSQAASMTLKKLVKKLGGSM